MFDPRRTIGAEQIRSSDTLESVDAEIRVRDGSNEQLEWEWQLEQAWLAMAMWFVCRAERSLENGKMENQKRQAPCFIHNLGGTAHIQCLSQFGKCYRI